MRCFLGTENGNLLRKMNVEFYKIPAGFQKLINESKIMPDYSFVPGETNDKFKRIYGSLFSEDFDFGYYSMVHKKSKSYEEFMKFMKTYTVSSKSSESWADFNLPIDAHKKRFDETTYRRKDKIFPFIKEHISSIVNSIEKVNNPFQSFFSATLVVLQSSGYGKSKTFIELGADIPVLYSSLQPSELGYPRKSFYMSTFVGKLDSLFISSICHSNTACAVVYAFVLRIIYIILQFKEMGSFGKAIDVDSAIDSILGNDRESNFRDLYNGLEDICKDPNL